MEKAEKNLKEINQDSLNSTVDEENKPDLNLPNFAILRKRFFWGNDSQGMVSCSVCWTKEKKTFKIQLFTKVDKDSTEFTQLESEVELAYEEVEKILKQVEYKDVLPANLHLKQITDYFSLTKYLLFPFIDVFKTEEKNEISIFPKAVSLLTGYSTDKPTIEFMGQKCIIALSHVINNTFRITLTDPEVVEQAFRMDLEFDQSSFDLCFQKYGGQESFQRSAQAAVKLIQGSESDLDDIILQEYKYLADMLNNPSRCDEEELLTFKVIKKDLFDSLGYIIKDDVENFLSFVGITKISQLVDEKEIKYCKLKIRSHMKKNTVHFLWDHPDKKILEVRLKNFYETFAPDKKISAYGELEYPYDSVWKQFGVKYEQLEHADKLAICDLVLDLFNMQVFEKDFRQEDYDLYQENAIYTVPPEVKAYHRTFLVLSFQGEKSKFPLTLSLIQINDQPVGIKATVYNCEEIYEGGAFFQINPKMWVKNESEKKKKLRRWSDSAFDEKYYLGYMLEKCGWDMLKNSIIYDKGLDRVNILGIKVAKEIREIERMENVITPDTILRFLNQKYQLF